MKCETVLPKNIRQIGEIQQNQRVYLEDYVMTFLRKKEKEAEQEEGSCFAGILAGSGEQEEDGFCIFIKGALLMDTEETEDPWEKLETEQKQCFPETEPVGCFVIGTLEETYVQEIMKHFEGTTFLIFHVQEGEENVYLAKENEYQRLKGYFIFYERNPGMQKYMAEHCREQQVEKEEGNSDTAIQSFRKKVKEKSGGKENRGMRYLASSFLTLTVLVLGITIINNYDKLREMEDTISRISQEQEQERQQLLAKAEEDLAVSSANVEADETKETAGETMTEDVQQAEAADGSGTGMNKSDTSENSGETQEASASAADQSAAASSRDILEDWPEELLNQEASNPEAQSQEAAEQGEADPEAQSGEIPDQETMSQTALNQETADRITGQISRSDQGLAERNYSAEEALDASSASAVGIEESSSLTGRNGKSVYTVKYGDTLADISVKYYGSLDMVEEICLLNQIDDANLIVPGEKIVLP
ncbi:MAG: LysM domain-containing protein [Lachnospiraceae bacterium]|nr:LysM domain-containing protein [Lachnospiraceae bacterium]